MQPVVSSALNATLILPFRNCLLWFYNTILGNIILALILLLWQISLIITLTQISSQYPSYVVIVPKFKQVIISFVNIIFLH